MAANQEHIVDIFRQAFESHEMVVSPRVWTGIESSLAASATTTGAAVATGSTFMAKAAAVVGMAGLFTMATVSEIKYHQQPQPVAETTVPVQHNSQESNAVAVEEYEDQTVETKTEASQTEPVVSDAAQQTVVKDRERRASSGTASIEKQDDAQPVADQTQTPEETDRAQTPAATGTGETAANTTQAEPDKAPEKSKEPVIKTDLQPKNTREEEAEAVSVANFSHEAQTWISANGDGTQDYFTVNGSDVQDFHIRIWTREGRLVFESNDIHFQWGGADLSGTLLPNRTLCYYEINAVGTDGIPYKKRNARGSVMVIH